MADATQTMSNTDGTTPKPVPDEVSVKMIAKAAKLSRANLKRKEYYAKNKATINEKKKAKTRANKLVKAEAKLAAKAEADSKLAEDLAAAKTALEPLQQTYVALKKKAASIVRASEKAKLQELIKSGAVVLDQKAVESDGEGSGGEEEEEGSVGGEPVKQA